MADEQNPNNPPNATPAPAASAVQPAATPPVYTQDQVEQMIKAQRDAVFAEARRTFESKQKQPEPSSTKPDPSTPTAPEQVASLVAQAVARESAFHEATREAGLTAAQSATLRKLMAVDNPQDAVAVTAWVKEQATVFGKTANQQATTPQTATQPTAPSVPAPIAASPPSTSVPLERDVSVLEMSAEQIHDLMRKKGGDPSNPYHPRNRAARREIRKETEAALRTRRVRLGS